MKTKSFFCAKERKQAKLDGNQLVPLHGHLCCILPTARRACSSPTVHFRDDLGQHFGELPCNPERSSRWVGLSSTMTQCLSSHWLQAASLPLDLASM